MKLVIFIPCLNEEKTLPMVLETIPKRIAGVDEIEILIVDDGSTDKTIEVAKKYGVKQFLVHTKNQGLSRSFRHGITRSLELGADIIVITDGDNQYPQEKIPELIRPIIDGKADVVLADRHTQTIEHFSPMKKFLQKYGTKVLNIAAGTNVPDAVTGFRAYSKNAAIQLNPVADYSWATETTIQASQKHQAIAIVPITTNPKTRDSRQFNSSMQHVRRSSITIVRAFIMYKPYALFLSLGFLFLIIGVSPFIRYFILYLTHNHPGQHLQSLLVGAVLLIVSFISFTLSVIADLIRINRSLIEDVLETQRRIEFKNNKSD